MASIPLPALDIRPPQQQDPAAHYLSLRSLLGQQRLQQQQIQGGQLENQQRQMDIDSQKALTKAYMEADGDPDKTTKLAAQYGAKPQALLQWQSAVLDQKTKTLDLVSKQGILATTQADLMQGAHDTVAAAGPQDRPQVYQQQRAQLQQQGVDVSQSPPQYPGDEAFKLGGIAVRAHTRQVEELLKQSEMGKNAAQEADARANAEKANVETQALKQFGGLTPQMMEAKYVSLATKQRTGQPLNGDEKAFMGAYEKQKTLIPTANFNLQNAGATGTPGQPSAIAQGLANGSIKWQDVVSARTPMSVKQSLLAEVKGLKPDFNSGDFQVEQAVKTEATSGAVGKQLLAIGTAREHMKAFTQLADALDNSNVQLANKIGNVFGVQFGSDKKTNFDIAAQAFGGEVGRAFDGAGVVAGERKQAEDNYNAAMSKGQFKGAIQIVDKLLAGKQTAAHKWFDQGIQAKPDFGQTSAQPATGNAQKLTGKGAKWGIAPVGAQ